MEIQNEARTDQIQSFDGVKISFQIRSGNEPTIVFVHGWAGERNFCWAQQLQTVNSQYQTVAIDLAGHGDSDDGRIDYTLGNFAKDVTAVVNHLMLNNVILVGHSMGGGVVLEAARMLGKKVQKVIVVDTFVFDYGQFTPDQIQGFLDSFDADYPAAIHGLVTQTCKPGTDITFINDVAGQMSRTPKPVGLAALKGLLSWNPDPVWDDIQAPIICINGDMINEDARKRHAGRYQEIHLPDTGHYLQIEATEHFNRLLMQALAQ